VPQDNAKSVCFLYGTPLANFDYNDHHIYTHIEAIGGATTLWLEMIQDWLIG
jgi:hypothetical protein